MRIAETALKNRVTTLVLTFVTLIGGYLSYQNLGRLEDPEFTIKDAVVITQYPGASAEEVELEVTDRIEGAVQQLGQLKEIRESYSTRGLSIVKVRIKDRYGADRLPQVWDELRRKVGDVQGHLPPGAGPSIVNDDFGDVYGIFFAITGDEYTYAELNEVIKMLRKELVLVDDVAKVEVFGVRKEAVYVELDRDRMSKLGLSPSVIFNELAEKNQVVNAGRVKVGHDNIFIEPDGYYEDVDDLENTMISSAKTGEQIFLRDIATVRRDYVDPPQNILRSGGKRAIGLGISCVSDGNVVTMGQAVQKRLDELQPKIPLGIEFGVVAMQSDAVTDAIDNFVVSLLQAVGIVIFVLLFFMGLRSGLLIGFVLTLTICATFIVMEVQGITLQRISLGALIIALGMLVDNAIVVVDGMLVRQKQGSSLRQAAIDIVAQTGVPLLGATAIAIMAFAAIGTSTDNTGEYTRSLFQVILISLALSWLTAVTVTPVLGEFVLKVKSGSKSEEDKDADPYDNAFYRGYRKFLTMCIQFRWATVAVVIGLFIGAVSAFGLIPAGFFPASTRPQLMVDYWMPQGTHIEQTHKEAREIEEYLLDLEGVSGVTSAVGQGPLRFLLTYGPEKVNPAYIQFLVDVEDHNQIAEMKEVIQDHLDQTRPQGRTNVKQFLLGPNEGGRIQIRVIGKNRDKMRDVGDQIIAILEEDGGTRAVWPDWRERVKTIVPKMSEEAANLAGVTRPDVATAIQQGFEGIPVGAFRDYDELLPIRVRAAERERGNVSYIQSLSVWSKSAQQMIPLRQVVSDFEVQMEDEIIMRYNRKRTMIVHADQRYGNASVVFNRIQPKVDALELPDGVEISYGGEYEDSANAQAGIKAGLPIFLLLMVLIVVMLFNGIKQPLIIWLTVPLAIIGVSAGLALTQNPFDFMAILGFLSLIGMLIKNAIVLIDEINVQLADGATQYDAIMASGTSRLMPVGMAASTTALGMIPLLPDIFFRSMAITIICGLSFASILTMVFVPVLYAIFYKVQVPSGPQPALAVTDSMADTVPDTEE